MPDHTVVALERAAVERRLDGLAGLTELCNPLLARVHIDDGRMEGPRAHRWGEMTLLTFQFVSRASEGTTRWNTAQVHREIGGWRLPTPGT